MTTNELRQALLASAAQGVAVPSEQQIAGAVGTNAETETEDADNEVVTEPETETETESTAIVRRTIRLNGKQFGPKRIAKLERMLDTTSLPLVVMALSQIMADRATLMSATPGLKRSAGKWDRAAKDLAAFAQRNSVKSCA
jgi:hypothetical protein